MILQTTLVGLLCFFGGREAKFQAGSPEGHNGYGKIVKGIYMNKLPHIRVYEASIPIPFVLQLPSLDDAASSYECAAQPYLCNLVTHTKQIRDIIMEEVIRVHPYLKRRESNSTGRQERGLFNFIGYTQRFLFGTAMNEDIDKLHVGMNYINSRQKELQAAVIYQQRALTEAVKNISSYSTRLKSVLEKDFLKLQSSFKEQMQSAARGEGALAQISANNMVNQYLLYVTGTLNEVASDCRNQLIPRSVLPTTLIDTRLEKLRATLSENGWELVTDSNGLWKLPIADCSFSENELQVAIHVPIRRIGHVFELFEVFSVPYQFQQFQCSMVDATQYVAKLRDSVVPISSHLQQFCNPADKTLCLIPQFEMDSSFFSSCALSIFRGSSEEITKECIFKCMESNRTRVMEVGQGLIAVTNAQFFDFICENDETIHRYNIKHQVGAVLIRMSCLCKVIINNDGQKILHPPFPCHINADLASATPIIPTQMSLMRNTILDELSKNYLNLSEIINFNWLQTVPVLTLKTPEPLKFKATNDLEKWLTYYEGSSSLIYVWLTSLTIAMVLSFLFSMLRYSPGRSPAWKSVSMVGTIMWLPCCACENESGPTITKAAWALLNAIEITNIIIYITIIILAIIVIVVTWKIFSYVKQTYIYTRSLVMDVDMGRTGR